MGANNRDSIGKALESLRQGLYVYVEQKMQSVYGSDWLQKAVSLLPNHQKSKQQAENFIREDVAALLTVLNKEWEKVFKGNLNQPDRALVTELLEVRNQWAHQTTFLTDDTYRAIDSVCRLLKSISSPQVTDVNKQRQDVLRILSQEQVRQESQPIQVSPIMEARIRQRLDGLLKRISFQNACLLNQALIPKHKEEATDDIREKGERG
ncbi:Swt1 family HEPN domain-containing protein [Pseudanabaena minima]|uniref:Swt1 family HEPN domain-containing protein n=1 Tax=Pseudanabaena minima TaxID=890415 RepID=UPI003DA87059